VASVPRYPTFNPRISNKSTSGYMLLIHERSLEDDRHKIISSTPDAVPYSLHPPSYIRTLSTPRNLICIIRTRTPHKWTSCQFSQLECSYQKNENSPTAGYPTQPDIAGTCFKQLMRPAPQSKPPHQQLYAYHWSPTILLVVSQGPSYTGYVPNCSQPAWRPMRIVRALAPQDTRITKACNSMVAPKGVV
jgi:hypothetical protein